MFIFDVETLGKKSDSVILSMAAIYFNPAEKPSPEEMLGGSFFVKLNGRDQIERLGRSYQKSTIEWWNKQAQYAKDASFAPKKTDVKVEDGYEMMREWAKSKNDKKCWVWARGNLDQIVLDDLEEQIKVDPIWYYSRWRDVRTAVDFLYGSVDGYCEIDYNGFDREVDIIKHHPTYDCLLDAMMLVYGREK